MVAALPGAAASARVRLWRAIKARGCAALGDGASLLPAGSDREAALDELASQVRAEGGQAWVLRVATRQPAEDRALRELFDRRQPYEAFEAELAHARATLARASTVQLSRALRRLARSFEALAAIDYFPGEASRRAHAAWAEFQAAARAALSPDEPHARGGAIEPRRPEDFRGRLWATRRHLWVDRVASAWLIRRFIDPQARFAWIESPAACPPQALGFDFDGAAFTHVGARVTFEVLLASFGLDTDAALVRLGALVHALDVGGAAPPEARGFEAILAGARRRTAHDDALLAAMSPVLDALHTHFCEDRTA